jgi:hypothetical protein
MPISSTCVMASVDAYLPSEHLSAAALRKRYD